MDSKRTIKELLKDLEFLYREEYHTEQKLAMLKLSINEIKLELLTNLNINK